MNYTSPDLSVMEEDLLSKRPGRFIVPFDEQNYLRYLEGIYSSKINFSGYSDEFKQAMGILIQEIFPLNINSGMSKSTNKMGMFRKK